MPNKPNNPNARAALCCLCLTLLGCDGTRRESIAPRIQASAAHVNSVLSDFSATEDGDESAAAATAALSAPVVTGGTARGHVNIFATPKQNVVEQSYSVTATSDGPFPGARGQFEGHSLRFTGETVNIHADVTCMAVVGNQAWIGLRMTRATVDEQEVPGAAGTPMTLKMLDSGEDAGSADAASLWFLGFASEIAFCETRPTTNVLRPSGKGNIQVRPQ